jgi:hypothetical protein
MKLESIETVETCWHSAYASHSRQGRREKALPKYQQDMEVTIYEEDASFPLFWDEF